MKSRWTGGRCRPSARGLVSVELAIGMVTLTVLVAILIGVVSLGVRQAAAAESSAQLARQLSRGDQVAAQQARDRSPGEVSVVSRDGGVEVTVRCDTRVPGLGEIEVRATTWAAYEPGENDDHG